MLRLLSLLLLLNHNTELSLSSKYDNDDDDDENSPTRAQEAPPYPGWKPSRTSWMKLLRLVYERDRERERERARARKKARRIPPSPLHWTCTRITGRDNHHVYVYNARETVARALRNINRQQLAPSAFPPFGPNEPTKNDECGNANELSGKATQAS